MTRESQVNVAPGVDALAAVSGQTIGSRCLAEALAGSTENDVTAPQLVTVTFPPLVAFIVVGFLSFA
jgi:hypothetical protein